MTAFIRKYTRVDDEVVNERNELQLEIARLDARITGDDGNSSKKERVVHRKLKVSVQCSSRSYLVRVYVARP